MGRKSKSGMSGGGTTRTESESRLSRFTADEVRAIKRDIDKRAFEKVSDGVWEFNTEGRIGIGAQILDETGSSRDPMYGRGGKVYGVTTWGPDPGQISPQRLFSSLNAAKTAAREEMKGWLEGAGR